PPLPVGGSFLAPPPPGKFRSTIAAAGTRVHNEHTSTEDGPPLVWHVQDIRVADVVAVAEYGLKPGLGLNLSALYRQVTTRTHFLDDVREPIDLPEGDIHHWNETLNGVGD